MHRNVRQKRFYFGMETRRKGDRTKFILMVILFIVFGLLWFNINPLGGMVP